MKTTQQYDDVSPEKRREFGHPRKNGVRKLEDERLSIPNPGNGFTTQPTPGPDDNNKGPALPPLPKGRNWNATRPKAPQANTKG